MRVTSGVYRRMKLWPEEPIPFKEYLPLKLRNYVSGKGQKTSDYSCLQELAVMFACMKENDFKETKCKEQINSYLTCFNENARTKKELKAKEMSGSMVPGASSKELTAKQLNKLLWQHPQFNEK